MTLKKQKKGLLTGGFVILTNTSGIVAGDYAGAVVKCSNNCQGMNCVGCGSGAGGRQL